MGLECPHAMGTDHSEEFRDRGAGYSPLLDRTGHSLGSGHEVHPRHPTRHPSWLDVVSLFGPHWQLILTTIPVTIFSLGFGLALRRFSRRLAG
jgi:hypothetical protein